MANYYWSNPETEYRQLSEGEARRRRFAAISAAVTPTMARAAAEIARNHPSLDPKVVASAAMAGIAPDNPGLSQVAVADATERNSSGIGALWNATGGKLLSGLRVGARAAFITFDSIWEEGMRFFRTGVAALSEENRGQSLADLYGQSGESSLRKIYEEWRADRPINIGAGILPGAEDPTTNPRYQSLIAGGASPEAAYKATVAEIGRPVVTEARAEAEQLQYRGLPISPGRVLWNNPVISLQPGSAPFNLLSGMTDAAAQIGLDPSFLALKATALARKSANLIGSPSSLARQEQTRWLAGRFKDPPPGAWQKGPHASQTSLMTPNKIRQFAEFDRRIPSQQISGTGRGSSQRRLERLRKSMDKRGIDEPLIMGYDEATGTAKLLDGHHRLALAEEMGWDALPVRAQKVSPRGVDSSFRRVYDKVKRRVGISDEARGERASIEAQLEEARNQLGQTERIDPASVDVSDIRGNVSEKMLREIRQERADAGASALERRVEELEVKLQRYEPDIEVDEVLAVLLDPDSFDPRAFMPGGVNAAEGVEEALLFDLRGWHGIDEQAAREVLAESAGLDFDDLDPAIQAFLVSRRREFIRETAEGMDPDTKDVFDFIVSWTEGDNSGLREAIRGVGGSPRTQRQADKFISFLRRIPAKDRGPLWRRMMTEEGELWRGQSIDVERLEGFSESVGKVIDMEVYSYTDDAGVARRFGSPDFNIGADAERVIFKIQGSNQAVPTHVISRNATEREFITGGQFRVVSVSEDARMADPHLRTVLKDTDPKFQLIVLEQVDVPKRPGTRGPVELADEFDPIEVMKPGNRRKIGEVEARRMVAGAIDTGKSRSVLHTDADRWLSSRNGTKLVDFLLENRGDYLRVNAALGGEGSRKLKLAIMEADSADEIADLLRLELGITIRHKPVPQGLLGTVLSGGAGGTTIGRLAAGAVGSKLGAVAGAQSAAHLALRDTNFGRLFARMPGSALVLDDLDRTMDDFDDLMVSMGFDHSTRSSLMAEMAGVEDGHFNAALGVVTDAFKRWEKVLVSEHKMNPELAKSFSRTFTEIYGTHDQLRQYLIDDFGHGWFPGAKVEVLENGNWRVLPTAQLWTQYLNRAIPLPDPRAMRKAMSAWRKLGQTLGPGDADKLVIARYPTRIADAYMQKLWKPMVLLRVAWPIRVIGEEQFRLAASGYAGAFNHPLSWWAWAMSKKAPKGRSGLLGELGEVDEFQAAMSRGRPALTGFGAGKLGPQTKDWVTYSKGSPEYMGGWSRSMGQLWFDPLAKRVARDGLDDTKRWMRTADGRAYRKQLAGDNPDKAFLINDEWNEIDLYVDSVEAAIRREIGGTYTLDASGTGLGPGGNRPRSARSTESRQAMRDSSVPGELETVSGSERFIFDDASSGSVDLRRSIANGRIGDINLAEVKAKGTTKEWNKVQSELSKYLDEYGPEKVKGPRELSFGKRKTYDEIINQLFTTLMSAPTNKLSRAPVFRQAYWKRVGELYGFADAQTQAKILKRAQKANITERDFSRLVRTRKRTSPLSSEQSRGSLGARDMDILAKGYALSEVQDLLYDLSRRHQITDIFRNIFPFGEAYLEIISTWERIMFQHPEIFRRGQQVFESSREAGFFGTNDQGEEVFNVPGGELLAKWMFGSTVGPGPGSTAPGIKLQGRLQSLNFVTGSYLPGFGPMVQIPAANLAPDEPHWDALRRFITPYGGDRINLVNPADYIKIGFPSWLTRLGQAAGEGGEYDRLYNNTTIDIMKGLLLTGRYTNASPDEFDRLMARAKSTSKWLSVVRGLATFVTPTAVTPEFAAWVPPSEDAAPGATSVLWGFQALVSEYRRMLDEDFDGDESAAFSQFRKTFGDLDPTLFAQPKTAVIQRRATTTKGVEWQQRHSRLFRPNQFPNTAYFAAPDDPDDAFDYNAYIRQIETKTRQPLSPTQWVTARNQTLGRIAYDLRRKEVLAKATELGEDPDDFLRNDPQARQYLKATKAYLMIAYPGYNEENIGTPKRADNEQLVRELQRWETEPELHETPAGRALQLYLATREKARQAAFEAGLEPDSFATATSLRWARDNLRSYAEWIMSQPEYQDFGYMWTFVLSHELRDDNDPTSSDPADYTTQTADFLLGQTG